ncbi:MAG TPA: competence protein CoiA family protein [Fimbriimonadaceae bacterium]|nr:competence protein CoiA family protein [Fimbriimonadaceae bacterium]
MQYAIGPDGAKIEAAKGRRAVCAICGGACAPKCGSIRIHHWAHVAGMECDPWWEPETEWHRAWKALFRPEFVEVAKGPHRADIANERIVVELQNSPISPEEIAAREAFYGSIIWIVNAAGFSDRFFLTRLMGNGVFAFRWKQMKPSWLRAKRPVYLDFGHTTVSDLRGARYTSASVPLGDEGDEKSFDRKTVVRYRGGGTVYGERSAYTPHESLANLTAWQLARTILRVNTMYASGAGSAIPVEREAMLKSHGLDPFLTFN